MEFASIIPNFFNILASTWMNILYTITLFFDGIVFSLVSLAFDVFIMTCQLNFDALYAVIAPLLDRIEAVIMVLVVFKLGISFIGYMIEPEKAPAEGKKLIINIFITAALLLSYNFIFSVFNDISMLLLGAPENYPYTTLSGITDIQPGAKDEGLIMRFVFGKNDAIKNSNIGDFMAYQTLSMFLSNTTDQDVLVSILDPDSDGDYEFTRLAGHAPKEIDKTLSYMPLVSMVVGLYLVYSIVKVSIEIGIRMFKMLILQILAPVAIITCIDGGVKSKTFSTYYKTFLSVFVQVFIRVFVMYVITVFVCKFFIALPDFFHELPSGSGFKKLMVAVVVIIAGFKMVCDIPKFIDEALGTKIAGADGGKGGFGKFVGGLIGGGIGAATGLAAGLAAGGLGNGLAGAVSGLATGAANGSKGNTIAERFKSIGTTTKNNRTRAGNIAAAGGLLPMALGGIEGAVGIGRGQDRKLAALDAQSKAIEAYEQAQIDEIKDKTMSEEEAGGMYASGYGDIKLGSDKNAYATQMLEYDKSYLAAQASYDAQIKEYEALYDEGKLTPEHLAEGIAREKEKLMTAKNTALNNAKGFYESKQNSASGDNVKAKKETMVRTLGKENANMSIKDNKTRIKNRKNEIQNTSSYERTHRSSGGGN